VDHKTISSARRRLEARGEIPRVDAVEDTMGRKRRRVKVEFRQRPTRAHYRGRGASKERFIVTPVSTLRVESSDWLERRAYWRQMGIDERVGAPPDPSPTDRWKVEGKTFTTWMAADSGFYAKKSFVEGKLGRRLSSWEFFENYYTPQVRVRGTSGFDPVLAEVAYRWFCPVGGKVLDPFSGGVVRGAVAGMMGHRYLGIDIQPSVVESNRRVWAEIRPEGAVDPVWVVGDSRRVGEIADGWFDLVFTCPPFYDLERYSDDERDLSNCPTYEDFLAAYRTIIEGCLGKLKPGRFTALVVGDVRGDDGGLLGLPDDTARMLREAGMAVLNRFIVCLPIGGYAWKASHTFPRTRKAYRAHLEMIVAFKGDPREVPRMTKLDDGSSRWSITDG
jgi:hypothetical protein